MQGIILILIFALSIATIDSAKILSVYTIPSISHQIVFRKVTLELVKQGHDVTVITTDPAFPNKDGPENLKEIDLHDVSYSTMRNNVNEATKDGTSIKQMTNIRIFSRIFTKVFESQIVVPEVRELIFNSSRKFDLIIIEDIARNFLPLSHIFKAPVILFSSFGGSGRSHDIFGSNTHPILYPTFLANRVYNLTLWEKIENLYKHYEMSLLIHLNQKEENKLIRKYFGEDIPILSELYKNVDLLLMNINSIWVDNQPVPPNIIYLGGLHLTEAKTLPKDLETYLNSSKHGVIYVSFGTNALSTMFNKNKIEIIARVLGQLPYDVLWKWDADELPGRSENIKLSKWLPQADLLKHPKIKLFITQAGLQSTDEAIAAGVPLVAFPVLADQWYNAEKYVFHGIGKQLILDDIDQEKVKKAVETVIMDESYRRNIKILRERIEDQPETPLQRAMYWINYVIRHKGAKHLQAAGAHLTWAQYFEIEVIFVLGCAIFIMFILFITCIYYICKLVAKLLKGNSKLKRS